MPRIFIARTVVNPIIALLLVLSGTVVAAPATRPATSPTTKPASSQPLAANPTATQPAAHKLSAAEARALEKKVLELTRKSIDLLKKNKVSEAEPVLKERFCSTRRTSPTCTTTPAFWP